MRWAGVAILLLIGVGISIWQTAINWTPSRATWPRQGIDVSSHQGVIDWKLLSEHGVDFAYIKATEGADRRDPSFAANWDGARKAAIPRGAYHFFTLCRSGAEQAANFIATVPSDPAMLSPGVDLEFGGNCAARPEPATFVAELGIYIRTVESRFHKPVTLYLTREFDAGYAVSTHFGRTLWLRSLVVQPQWSARAWTIWQASSFRRIAGIRGRVDWNVMRVR